MVNSSFTNVFTGNPVWTANESYATYSITGNISLNWPTQFLDNPYVIGNFTTILADNNGHIVTLPSAQAASVGVSIQFINNSPTNVNFILHDNEGNTLVTINQGKVYTILLTSNSTDAGSWIVFPFAQGTTAVTSVSASTTSAGLTITGSPITSVGTLNFSLASPLNTLSALNTVGLIVQRSSGPSVMSTVSLVGGTNIDVTNGDGAAANPTINLSDTLVGLSSIVVGSFTISNHLIQTTSGNTSIQLSPNGTGSILLGRALTPPTVSSTGDITNVNDLSSTTLHVGDISISTNIITNSVVNGNVNIEGNGTGSVFLQPNSSNASNVFSIDHAGILNHPSVNRIWGVFTGSTGALTKSYNNITSVVRNSAGNYTVNLGVIFNGDYVVIADCIDGGAVGIVVNTTAFTSTQFTLQAKNIAGSAVDPSKVSFVCIGVI